MNELHPRHDSLFIGSMSCNVEQIIIKSDRKIDSAANTEDISSVLDQSGERKFTSRKKRKIFVKCAKICRSKMRRISELTMQGRVDSGNGGND